MATISLYLSKASEPELYRTVFSHPVLPEPRLTVRGKTGGAYRARYTFQWTPAVQALTVFLMRSSVTGVSGNSPKQLPVFSGSRGSAISSLDFAISKQPQWLQEMFGIDRKGRSLIKHLIIRSNTEGKLPGPVRLTLNDKQLPPAGIKIFLDGSPVTDASMLAQIANRIETRSKHRSPVELVSIKSYPIDNPVNTESVFSRKKFVDLLTSEAHEMLWRTDIFNLKNIQRSTNELHNNPSIVRVAGKNVNFFDKIDSNLNSVQRLGMGVSQEEIKREFSEREPVRVVAPWIMYSPLILFEYLKRQKGFNFAIDYEWAYAIEVRRALEQNSFEHPPDLCVLAIGPAASLIAQGSKIAYRPLMLLPNISHRVLVPEAALAQNKPLLGRGEYYFLCEEPSSPEFCFEEMERKGVVNRKQVSVSHLEPDEASLMLREQNPDARMLMFFPHYSVNSLLNNCVALPAFDGQSQMKESVLFASENFLTNRKRSLYLDIALRNAWLELREDPSRIAKLIEELVSDQRFVRFFSRMSGLHNLPGAVALNAQT